MYFFYSTTFFQVLATRKDKVAKLFEILPRRGPDAFIKVHQITSEETPWLGEHMIKVHKNVSSKQRTFEENLIKSINQTLVPFVDAERTLGNYNCSEDLIDSLEKLINDHIVNCLKELGNFRIDIQIPLHVLIHEEMRKAQENSTEQDKLIEAQEMELREMKDSIRKKR